MSLESMFDEMKQETQYDSDFLKLEKGKNTIRIVSEFQKVEVVYKGVYPNSKYKGHLQPGQVLEKDEKVTRQGWAWVINRATGELKIAQFGKNILEQIVALKNDPEYAFKEFPSPYDITINNTGEGANRYTVIAARQNTEIDPEYMAELNKKKSIADIIGAIIDKQTKSPVEDGEIPSTEGPSGEIPF